MRQQFANKLMTHNMQSDNYDQTYFGIVVKNCYSILPTLTKPQQKQLDVLGADWYYVQLLNQFYKIKCEDANFKVGQEVKVCVPCGDWNRIYISNKNKNTFREWVRPAHWLPMPDVKDDEVWILTEGTGGISIDCMVSNLPIVDVFMYLSRNTSSISSTYDEQYCITTSGWGWNEGWTDINTTYSDDSQRWLKIKTSHYMNTHYSIGEIDGTHSVRILEVLVGKNVALNLQDAPCSLYDNMSTVHFKTAAIGSVSMLLGCRSLEFTRGVEHQGISGMYYSGDILHLPTNILYIDNYGLYNPNIKYINYSHAKTVNIPIAQDCITLQRVDMPKAKEVSSFSGDTYFKGLSEVHCPNIQKIAKNTFTYKRHLYNINAGNNEIELGESAFSHSGLYTIDNLNIPNISKSCFMGCLNLQTIFNTTIQTIQQQAFADCRNLIKVNIPNCTSIAAHAFDNCILLRSLTVSKDCQIDEKSGINLNYTQIIYV